MQKTDSTQQAASIRRKVKGSTTLNRKYVKRPMQDSDTAVVYASRSQKISKFGRMDVGTQQMLTSNTKLQAQMNASQPVETPVQPHPMQVAANAKMHSRRIMIESGDSRPQLSAKQLKDQAIQKALAATTVSSAQEEKKSKHKNKKYSAHKLTFGFGRVLLALSCTAAAVFAIVYFVNLNMPDMSLKVAAMQTGISASYPGYVPHGYSVSGITSEDKKITMDFRNSTENSSFTLTEEASSWDSNALLNNYVKESYGENFATVREQGLTIYVGNDKAAWVSCGVFYEITTDGGKLTNKQIRAIATSL